MSTKQKITKKQARIFAIMYMGSMALYQEPGYEDCEITPQEIQMINAEISTVVGMLLGDIPTKSTVREILDFVKNI